MGKIQRLIGTKLYLLSRYIIKNSKKYHNDREIILRHTIMGLIERRPRTVLELSNLFSVNHSFMSATLAKMEKEGIIKKEMAKDQRYRHISLSLSGKKEMKQIYSAVDALAEGFFSEMTEQEIHQLGELLSKLNFHYGYPKNKSNGLN